MKKIFAMASVTFSLLCFMVFFIIGLFVAGWLDAGAGQGLAGGAIVLGYGVIFASIAFIGSLFMTYHADRNVIIKSNWTLLTLLILSIMVVFLRIYQ